MTDSKELKAAADYCLNNDVNKLQTLLENKSIKPNDILSTYKYKISRTNVPLLCVCVIGNSIDCARLLIQGLVECVQILLEAGVKADFQDASGRSPLHLSCWHGHAATIPLLLAYHANVDLRDFEGNTPLHYACWNGNLEICAALLKAGATVDMQDQAGRTPLYYSVQHKHPDIVQYLLENHSDPTIQSCTGVTPELLANQENIFNIVEIFQRYNKELNEKNPNEDGDDNANGVDEGNYSTNNALGKQFTEEHNRMKAFINKLIEGRDEEMVLLQRLDNHLEDHNAQILTVQNNIKDTLNQLKIIEQVLKEVMITFDTVATRNSSLLTTNPNSSQMTSSTNGSVNGPSLDFTGLNSASGSNILFNTTNPNIGISPLLPTQNEQKRNANKDQTKLHNDLIKTLPVEPLCTMCQKNPAQFRCKYCRSPFCKNCIQIVKQKGHCPYCVANAPKIEKP